MYRENWLTLAAANIAGVPFRLFGRRPFTTPHKVLILKPCCISQVMLATPLLSVLHHAFPQATFDWAVCQHARSAIESNLHVASLIDAGQTMMPGAGLEDLGDLIKRLKEKQYDTCIIPSPSSFLSYVAWRAAIPQRIGLSIQGRGFAHTYPVKPPAVEKNEARIYLSIAKALGIDDEAEMEFHPADQERTKVTERLRDEIGWDGIAPLTILHPGGGDNPFRSDTDKRWPIERFAMLGSRLTRTYGAKVVLLGAKSDQAVVEEVLDLMSVKASNLCAKLTLGELGALCEVADLYVGNDTGPTQIAVSMGCPTLTIFGPTDSDVSGPFTNSSKLQILQAKSSNKPFTWENGASVDDAIAVVDKLLGLPPDHLAPTA